MTKNERKPGESFAEFKVRRAKDNTAQKRRCNSGRWLWNSSEKGTYVRAIHGELR